MGFVIESPEIAYEIQTICDLRVLENSYEVLLKKNGGLRWIEKTENGDIVYNREPKTGWIQLRMIRFLSRLPIEWLLYQVVMKISRLKRRLCKQTAFQRNTSSALL